LSVTFEIARLLHPNALATLNGLRSNCDAEKTNIDKQKRERERIK